MLNSLAANAVMALHLLFILFAAFGGVLVLGNLRWAFPHLPALAWAVWIEATHGICPLTPLENSLRNAAGEAGYPGGFMEHYAAPLIYPPGLTAEDQTFIALGLLLLNGLLYGAAMLLYWARHRA